jgi:predicted dehydrogenase
LKRVTATAIGVSAGPWIIPSSALGRGGVAAPSERVSYGYIGCGGHGAGWNFDRVFGCEDAQIIAVCDVDSRHLKAAKAKVDAHYSRRMGKDYNGCAAHDDFRELVNRLDIDVVGIATPDHWHVIPAIMAAKAGKDVICEKPLSLTVVEGRMLSDMIHKTGRVFQTATELRSIDVYLRLAELVRGGVLGQLTHIEVRLPPGNVDSRLIGDARDLFHARTIEAPPKELNYDRWLGQAPWMPYVPARVHGNFRWNLAFSGGVITDWGAHMIDLAQWGHATEVTGPVTVDGQGDLPVSDEVHNTAATFRLHYQFADDLTMTVSAGNGEVDPSRRHVDPVVGRTMNPGIRFEGTNGWIESHGWRGSLRASRREILDAEIDSKTVNMYRPSQIIARTDSFNGGEHRNFVDCVKSRQPCYAPAETAHRTITIAHIGNIAMRLGRKLRWDPSAERFIGDAEADKLLGREQREPWTIANIDSWIDQPG